MVAGYGMAELHTTCSCVSVLFSLLLSFCSLFFFFFSSRRRHTRYWRDWSSDVCSSDLIPKRLDQALGNLLVGDDLPSLVVELAGQDLIVRVDRSEERRVGKECRSRWSAEQ